MTVSFSEIQSPVVNELKEFDDFFKQSFQSRIGLLNTILKYIIKRKGKQMRPLFVLLSAALNGSINQKTYRGASLIELLHTATLVHDDVVDDSSMRRGAFSINALWKNKAAVLVGDYLLSRGMLLALSNKDNEMLEITSDAVRMMSEGELLQIEKARTLDIDESVYFEIIRMKTASLIATSCAIGAASVNATSEKVDLMRNFGESVGLAFQIKDDLLDFSGFETGKPTGVDIKEKKLTLPVIYSLKQANSRDRSHIKNMISRSVKDKKQIVEIIEFIRIHKGFEYAQAKMMEYKDKANEIIGQYPDNQYRTALKQLIDYTIERNK
jgi:octaprenyl-diphosphate synthase